MRRICLGPTARAISLLAIGAAIVAADVRLSQRNVRPAAPFASGTANPDGSLAHELIRCRAIAMKAEGDPACQAAWAENHRRFFAPLVDHPQASTPSPNVMQPR